MRLPSVLNLFSFNLPPSTFHEFPIHRLAERSAAKGNNMLNNIFFIFLWRKVRHFSLKNRIFAAELFFKRKNHDEGL